MKTTTKMIKILLFLLIIVLGIFIFPTIRPYFDILFNIFINIFIALGLAYVSYPIIKFLKNKGIPSKIASLCTAVLLLSIVVIIIYLIVKLMYPQVLHAINLVQKSSDSIQWIKDNHELKNVIDYITPYLDKIGQTLLNYIASFTQNIINKSTNFIASTILIIIMYFYAIFDHENIIANLKKRLENKPKLMMFFKKLDLEFLKYIRSLAIICAITCLEYGIIYKIVGHPDWLSLAALCAFSNLIPYFGGILVNLIALFTAIFISPTLFFIIMAICLIMPNIDGNVINPLVYKNTIKISPLVILPGIFIASGLFGFLGILLTIPSIIFYRVFKEFYGKNTIAYIKKIWHS
ncbi:MAG: AI-2E family transporter [Bacilli bacterium]|jgi:predicted PurR-regulated permease PerM|nr:AI-2E family transporter [Bacilli bacterium]